MSEVSNIVKHNHIEQYTFDFDKSEILSRETNWYRRVLRECLHTEETYGKSLNDVKYKLKIFE